MITMVEKSVKNYIGWWSQSTTKFWFCRRYQDLMISRHYDVMIFDNTCNILYYARILLYYILLFSCTLGVKSSEGFNVVVGDAGSSTSATSSAHQTHLKRTSNAPQTHLKRTSNAPQTHLKPSKSLTKTM